MTNAEIVKKLQDLKAKRDYILASRMQLFGFEPIGFMWSLRFDARKQYQCGVFGEIIQEVGADDAFIESKRGLWLHLHFYTKEKKQ